MLSTNARHTNFGYRRNKKSATAITGHASATAITGHSPYLVPWLLVNFFKFVIGCAVVIFICVPVVIRFNPWLLTEVVFLHKVRWPPTLNLSDPMSVGLPHTHSFTVTSTDNVLLGAWLTLPYNQTDTDATSDPRNGKNFFDSVRDPSSHIILYLHGNAGTRAGWHRMQLYKVLALSGFHVICFDYRGFGDSTGSPSENKVVFDSLAMYRWIRHENSQASVIIWGHSLGSAIATKLVAELHERNDPPAGLILEAPFNNLHDAAFSHPLASAMKFLPWFSWAFLEPLQSEQLLFETDINVHNVHIPILILHAEDDGIVPYKLGKRLYDTVMATSPNKPMEFVSFDGLHGYGHKHMWKAPELPTIVIMFAEKLYENKKK